MIYIKRNLLVEKYKKEVDFRLLFFIDNVEDPLF
jgi:hypothetical protein